MTILSSLFSVLLSAILLSLGIPNELFKMGSFLFGLTALVPFYIILQKAPNWRRAGLLGGCMMMTVHILSSFWLANFKEFAIFTLGASAAGNFGIGFLAGALLWYALTFPEYIRPFLFAAVWMIWEWFKSIGFLAYPWGTLIMTSRALSPLIQIVDVTGTWGISFLFALFSALLGEALSALNFYRRIDRTVFRRTALFVVFLFTLAGTYGAFMLSQNRKSETELNIVMVQQNGDSWEEDGQEKSIMISQKLTRDALARSGKKADLIVWSEETITSPYLRYKNSFRSFPPKDPLIPFLEEINTPLLVGSPVLVDPENDGYSNSVILLSPKGEQLDWYGKIQLVPFAEYMPFTEYKFVRDFFDALVGFSRGWVPGKRYEPLEVKNAEGRVIHFAAPVCFEDAFPSVTSRLHNTGSDLLINLTNDSWSKTDSAEYQHFVIASFRAIELRTTLVRSTNAGYSVVIDPKGRIISDMPLFVADSRFVTIPIYPHITTFYARFGDWLPELLSLVLASFFLFSSIRQRMIDRKRSFR